MSCLSNKMDSLTIMMVDDDPIALEVFAEALESVGYRVIRRQAALGTTAAILKSRPDVVLLDVNMPGLSGDCIVRVLARRSGGQSTLAILCSEDPPDVLNRLVSDCGAAGGLSKALDRKAFLQELGRIISSFQGATLV